MAAPIDVYISFAQEDDTLQREFEKHLSAMRRDGLIRDWSCRHIIAGVDVRKQIDARLEAAHVILLLVSADFLASDYCNHNDGEVARALARQRDGEARVILISVRACDLTLSQFKGLEVLPRNGEAVTSWGSRDKAWKDVALGLRKTIGEFAGPWGTYRKPTPSYPDEMSRVLSERLEAARARKRELEAAKCSIAEVDQEILSLRRELREGGQLKAGDSLGEGRYLLLDHLGRGGFAIVWRALDRKRNEQVAIKVLHSEIPGGTTRRERFLRGARSMADLAHEGVVRVLAPHGEDGGYHYFVMELVTGGDLRRAVLEKRVGGDEVLPIILQVGEALAKAHDKGYVHRDVKPANILLDEAKVPRLTDFDLVGGLTTTGGTRTGPMGTVIYAAPEMMQHPQDADPRADVYGLGMTAVFGLAGRELPLDVVRDAGPVIEGLPCAAAVKTVLKRAVAWKEADRFQGMAEFCEALREAAKPASAEPLLEDDVPVSFRSWLRAHIETLASPRAATVGNKPRGSPRRSRAWWLMPISAAALVGGIGLWVKLPYIRPSQTPAEDAGTAGAAGSAEVASASPSSTAASPPTATATAEPSPPSVASVGATDRAQVLWGAPFPSNSPPAKTVVSSPRFIGKLTTKSYTPHTSTPPIDTKDGASKPHKEPATGRGKVFDTAAARLAMSKAAEAAKGCKKDGGPTGHVNTTVIFGTYGNVEEIRESPLPGIDPSCIYEHFMKIRVPPFDGVPIGVSTTIDFD